MDLQHAPLTHFRVCTQVRLLLAGKDPLPGECIMHPGRKVCKVNV
jgi:hypothetical protein